LSGIVQALNPNITCSWSGGALTNGQTSAVDFGSQDRNYVLQPYQQVKDLRSGVELTNPDAVLDGDLDGLMEAFLRWQRAEGITA
jgi:peptide chain release factor 2